MRWVTPLNLNLVAHRDGLVNVPLEPKYVGIELLLLVVVELEVDKHLLAVYDRDFLVVLDAHAGVVVAVGVLRLAACVVAPWPHHVRIFQTPRCHLVRLSLLIELGDVVLSKRHRGVLIPLNLEPAS